MPNPYPPFFHLRRLSWAWNSEINSTIFVFRTALYIIEQDMKKRIQPNFLGFRKSESIRLFSWGGCFRKAGTMKKKPFRIIQILILIFIKLVLYVIESKKCFYSHHNKAIDYTSQVGMRFVC